MKELMQQTQAYLSYIKEHYSNVQRAWKEIICKCQDMEFVSNYSTYEMIEDEILNHDKSKLSDIEFSGYRKAFYPTTEETMLSKANSSSFETDTMAYDAAWEHHLKNNDHHWQNWTERFKEDDDWVVPCVHMICDWVAMGYRFSDTAQQYYETNKNEIHLPEFAIPFAYQIFDRLRRK